MSVADVQRAFVRGLDGRGSCKVATIDLEDGGRMQRLSFHVVSTGAGAAYLSETIPADFCPMQHARTMAQNYLEGRITGQSRYVAAPVQAVPVQSTAVPVAQAAFVAPSQPVPMPPAWPAPVTPAAPLPVPQVVSAPVPQSQPAAAELPDALDALDAAIAIGDTAATIELICQMIDVDAGAIRAVWANDNPGQLLEYEQVRREINDLAYGLLEPSSVTCPCLWASVGVDVPKTGDDGADIRAAASLINDTIDATNGFLARVRGVRLSSKGAVRAAPSIETALDLYQAITWPTA